MLVLTRRVDESVLIGDNIEVKILRAGPVQVRLGIAAPKEMVVLRKELPKRDSK